MSHLHLCILQPDCDISVVHINCPLIHWPSIETVYDMILDYWNSRERGVYLALSYSLCFSSQEAYFIQLVILVRFLRMSSSNSFLLTRCMSASSAGSVTFTLGAGATRSTWPRLERRVSLVLVRRRRRGYLGGWGFLQQLLSSDLNLSRHLVLHFSHFWNSSFLCWWRIHLLCLSQLHCVPPALVMEFQIMPTTCRL